MLAKTLRACPVDPKGYWMSEKIDGVRAYWDGNELISRQGNVFAAPAWFIECLPDVPLDGELWMGRGTFNQTSGIVRRAKPHEGWRYLTYHVFDAPEHGGVYEDRQKYLERVVKKAKCQFLKKIPVEIVKSRAHLDQTLKKVVDQGGEGLMIVRPRSPYTPKRTDCILKIKKAQDAEATVIGHVPGKGRHKGRMGALLVSDRTTGQEFKVGTGFSDAERTRAKELFPPGTVITYEFFELGAHGRPREPRFLRIRSEEPQKRKRRATRAPAPAAKPARRKNVQALHRRLTALS